MSLETNKLVGKAGRIGAPVGAALALALAAAFTVHHSGVGVHAAMISSPPPMNDNSVSSLVSLDNAVAAVAAPGAPTRAHVAVPLPWWSMPVVGVQQNASDHGVSAWHCAGRGTRSAVP